VLAPPLFAFTYPFTYDLLFVLRGALANQFLQPGPDASKQTKTATNKEKGEMQPVLPPHKHQHMAASIFGSLR
jgi:hypothetical protein